MFDYPHRGDLSKLQKEHEAITTQLSNIRTHKRKILAVKALLPCIRMYKKEILAFFQKAFEREVTIRYNKTRRKVSTKTHKVTDVHIFKGVRFWESEYTYKREGWKFTAQDRLIVRILNHLKTLHNEYASYKGALEVLREDTTYYKNKLHSLLLEKKGLTPDPEPIVITEPPAKTAREEAFERECAAYEAVRKRRKQDAEEWGEIEDPQKDKDVDTKSVQNRASDVESTQDVDKTLDISEDNKEDIMTTQPKIAMDNIVEVHSLVGKFAVTRLETTLKGGIKGQKIDIRELYTNGDDALHPGKRGLRLTPDEWLASLGGLIEAIARAKDMSHVEVIEQALKNHAEVA